MPDLSYLNLTNRARRSLSLAPGNRALVLISAGASAALALLVSACNLLLEQGIDTTGGLGGLGMRSILSTVQSLLTLAMTVALPFWELGYTSATLKLARNHPAAPATLLDGFRCLFPALRLMLLTILLYFLIGFAAINIGSTLLSATPLAAPAYELLLPLLESGADPTAIDPEVLLPAMAPILIGCAVLGLAALIPVSYRLRMAQLCLLDDPAAGGLKAMLTSNRLMKGNCLALLRLDLHFWWYALAQVALSAISYGDVLLPALGIRLPMSATVAYFVFYALALGLQLWLYTRVNNRIFTTYAHAYLELLPRENRDSHGHFVPSE